MDSFSDRVAVVTGAGSGIGRGLALRFAAEGAKVVLADVQQDALDESTQLVRDAGAEALGVRTDVTSADSVEGLAEATIERFGAAHILCNNAGVGGGGLIANQQLVDWEWVIGVSTWGVIHGVHFFLPHLRAHGDEAHIVSTASVAGLMAVPGLGPYNAAKFAVVAIMETLHHELAQTDPQIGVSVLCPGTVRTNIATAQRNRPEHLRRQRTPRPEGATSATSDARRRNANIAAALESGMDPAEVADKVANAIKTRQFWILTHPELLKGVQHRNESLHQLTNPTLLSSFTDGE